MELDVQTGALLLLLAAVVAMLTRRLRLPCSVGLVAAGIGLAAFYLHWDQLRRNFSVVLVLATLGVVLSAGVTAPVS